MQCKKMSIGMVGFGQDCVPAIKDMPNTRQMFLFVSHGTHSEQWHVDQQNNAFFKNHVSTM